MCPAPPRDAVGSPRASWLRTTVCRLKRLIFVRKKGKEKKSAKKESCTWSCHDQKYTVGRVLAHFRYNVFEDVQILLQQSARILFVGRSITDRDHAHRRVSGQRIIWGNGRNAFPLFRSSLHFVPPPSKRDKKKKEIFIFARTFGTDDLRVAEECSAMADVFRLCFRQFLVHVYEHQLGGEPLQRRKGSN